jgi:hypothetical protein
MDHIPGLKITQIKIPRNVVDDVGTLTTWRHMKTSSLKRKDQTSLGLVYASILIKFKGRHSDALTNFTFKRPEKI